MASEYASLWLSEDDWQTEEEIAAALPIVLGPRDLSIESVDELFQSVASRLSAAEAESLGDALRDIGRWSSNRDVQQIAGAVLPVAGGAIGTAIGGPIGTAIGTDIGRQAGQAVSAVQRDAAPPLKSAPPPATAMAPGAPATGEPSAARSATSLGDGSSSAAQLLYLIQNPVFLSSLVSLALGSQGQSSIPLGPDNKAVPVGAFVNLASDLVGKVTEDADALGVSRRGADDDLYLKEADGEFACDPFVPSERAKVLMNMLRREDESSPAVHEFDDWDEAGDCDSDQEW